MKMKKGFLMATLMTATLMLGSVCFVGCAPTNTPTPTPPPANNVDAATVNGNNLSQYCIAQNNFPSVYAQEFATQIKNDWGYDLDIVDEANTDYVIDLFIDNSLVEEGEIYLEVNGRFVSGVAYSYAGASYLIDELKNLFQKNSGTLEIKDTLIQEVKYSIADYTSGKVTVTGTSLKNSVEYQTGDTCQFLFTTSVNGAPVDGLSIRYTAEFEDGTQAIGSTIKCENGDAIAEFDCNGRGFALIKAEAYNGAYIVDNQATFIGGIGVDVEDMQPTTAAPNDFESHWQTRLADINAIQPEVISMDEITSPVDTLTMYEVKVKAVDDSHVYSDDDRHDYVSLILSIPKNITSPVPVKIGYAGHGVYGFTWYDTDQCIVIKVCAHSIGYAEEQAYYTNYNNGDLNGYEHLQYGGVSYFENMLLRDYQVVRWAQAYLTEYNQTQEIWNGKINLSGGSQGGFQAVAVSALCAMSDIEINMTDVSIVWNCNLSNTQENALNWGTVYNDATKYIDTAYFAPYVESPVTVSAGLGDTISPPSSIATFYNELQCEKKITFYQNMEHGNLGAMSGQYAYTLIG